MSARWRSRLNCIRGLKVSTDVTTSSLWVTTNRHIVYGSVWWNKDSVWAGKRANIHIHFKSATTIIIINIIRLALLDNPQKVGYLKSVCIPLRETQFQTWSLHINHQFQILQVVSAAFLHLHGHTETAKLYTQWWNRFPCFDGISTVLVSALAPRVKKSLVVSCCFAPQTSIF